MNVADFEANEVVVVWERQVRIETDSRSALRLPGISKIPWRKDHQLKVVEQFAVQQSLSSVGVNLDGMQLCPEQLIHWN
jgi:hypothetical protein